MCINCYLFPQKFADAYQKQAAVGPPSANAQFEYAWCLVRSKYPADLRKGVALLEGMFIL